MTLLFWVLAVFVFLLWFPNTVAMFRGYRRIPRLPQIQPLPPDACPRLSIIVPACNEAETVEPAMRSLLAMDYPNMEIIAIDDRSTDGTGEILDRLTKDDPRVRVVHIKDLPDGWLGKNNALQRGSEMARGEWLLFTDADVIYTADAMRRAMAVAVEQKTDHLVALPQMVLHGFWERVLVTFFGTMFNFRYRPWEAHLNSGRGYIGVGAFNMVRAETYRKLRGHESLRMDVIDDVKLGKMIRRNGYKQSVAIAEELIRVRWLIGLRGIIHGLAKNSFAGCDYSWPVVIASGFLMILGTSWPLAGLFVGPLIARVLCGIAFCSTFISAWGLGRSTRVSAAYAMAWPLAGLVIEYTIVRSGVLTTRQGGIYWRGTFYPLAELKKNQA